MFPSGKKKRRGYQVAPIFDKTMKFHQHSFDTRIETRVPEVVFTPRAFDDMWHLVDLVSTEVSWLGSVSRNGDIFTINEIFVPQQTCSMVSTELSEAGLAALGEELINSGKIEIVNSLKFWGHSHVNMGTSPSPQDNSQMESFKHCEYFIRGILNKLGRIEISIYFFNIGITYHDVPWSVQIETNPQAHDQWKRVLEAKVKEQFAHHVYRYQDFIPPECIPPECLEGMEPEQIDLDKFEGWGD